MLVCVVTVMSFFGSQKRLYRLWHQHHCSGYKGIAEFWFQWCKTRFIWKISVWQLILDHRYITRMFGWVRLNSFHTCYSWTSVMSKTLSVENRRDRRVFVWLRGRARVSQTETVSQCRGGIHRRAVYWRCIIPAALQLTRSSDVLLPHRQTVPAYMIIKWTQALTTAHPPHEVKCLQTTPWLMFRHMFVLFHAWLVEWSCAVSSCKDIRMFFLSSEQWCLPLI